MRAELTRVARPPYVLVVALGGVTSRVVGYAGGAIHHVLGVASKAGPILERPAYAFNEARGQYHSAAILRRLASLRPNGGVPVLGIGDFDLFVPDTPFVFGDADRDAGAALYSVARLANGDPERFRRRAEVEAVHEVGHLLGLSHCPDWRCAMFLSRDSADTDRKGPGLCAACKAALGAP